MPRARAVAGVVDTLRGTGDDDSGAERDRSDIHVVETLALRDPRLSFVDGLVEPGGLRAGVRRRRLLRVEEHHPRAIDAGDHRGPGRARVGAAQDATTLGCRKQYRWVRRRDRDRPDGANRRPRLPGTRPAPPAHGP